VTLKDEWHSYLMQFKEVGDINNINDLNLKLIQLIRERDNILTKGLLGNTLLANKKAKKYIQYEIDVLNLKKETLKHQDKLLKQKNKVEEDLKKESALAKQINSLLNIQSSAKDKINAKYSKYKDLVNTTYKYESSKIVQIHKLDVWRAKALLNYQQKAKDLYLSIMGTDYDKWLKDTSDKMAELAGSGAFTNKQLRGLLDTMQQDYSIDLTVKGLDDANSQMQSMLDSQIALAQSGMNWGNSLTGTAKDIANISKSLTNLDVGKLKYNKADIKLQNDYAKSWLKLEKQRLPASEKLIKQKALSTKFTKEQKALNESKTSAEIKGYADLAGSMSGFYEAGSAQAKAFQAIQATLGIVNGITAIQGAWASAPFPANIPAVVATTAAMLPNIAMLSQLGGSGGASGGASAPSRSDVYKQKSETYLDNTKPITDRLDRQIELLQAISGYGGSAVAKQLFNLRLMLLIVLVRLVRIFMHLHQELMMG